MQLFKPKDEVANKSHANRMIFSKNLFNLRQTQKVQYKKPMNMVPTENGIKLVSQADNYTFPKSPRSKSNTFRNPHFTNSCRVTLKGEESSKNFKTHNHTSSNNLRSDREPSVQGQREQTQTHHNSKIRISIHDSSLDNMCGGSKSIKNNIF